MSEHIQRFVGTTYGSAFHEPVVIVYARELNALEQRVKGLRGILAEALMHLDASTCQYCGKLDLGETDAADTLRRALAAGGV